MSSAVRAQAIIFSVVLHVAIVAALTLGIRWPERQHFAAANAAPIQATIVNQEVLDREIERREQVQRQETQRRQRVERDKREAAEAARREREDAAKREQERVALAERRREEAARQQREEAQRRKREADAAALQRRQAEAELQQALTAEEERNQAERAGLLDEYARLIQNQITRNWTRPPSAIVGLDCTVNVVQIPSGDVIDVRVGACNGDDVVIRSIEAAVRRASPLPKPPTPALFERNLVVRFHPDL